MKNKFAIGALAGMLSLAVAVPLLAQVSGAQGTTSSAAPTQTASGQQVDAKQGGHVGANGSREELLTGDNAARATTAALAAVPGGTVDRVETDADGGVYEAHMTKPDGSHVTVIFDANFQVTEIQEGRGGGPKGRQI